MTLARFTFTDRVRPVVEVGIGSSTIALGQARWSVSRWNDAAATWAGSEPTWRDVTCFVQQVNVSLGRTRTTEPFTVGRAEVVADNSTGWADEPPFEDDPILTLRPGRALRIGVVHETLGLRWLYRGFLDELDPLYDPVRQDVVILRGIDALGEVNRAKLIADPAPTGDGETATARIIRTLDKAKWIADKRVVESSSAPLVATDLGGQVADLLGRSADSVGGAVYGDTNGNVVFRNRDWQTFLAGTPPDAVIGNVDAGDVCPTSWVRPYARADITTRVILDRSLPAGAADTPARQYDDLPAQTLYGIEPYERLDLWTKTDADLDTLGNRLLRTRGAATAPRIRSVSLDARTGDDVVDLLTTADPYKPSRYLCRLEELRGLVFTAEHFVTGIRHEMVAGRWSADLDLDVAAPYAVDSTLSKWNTNLGWSRTYWTGPPALAEVAS